MASPRRKAATPSPPMPNSQSAGRTIEERTSLNEQNIARVAEALRELSQDIRRERETDRVETARSRQALEASINNLREVVSQTQKTNWPLIVGILTFLTILVSGGVKYIELTGQNQNAPLVAMAEVSKAERVQNRDAVIDLGKKVSETAHEVGLLKSSLALQLIETETQMRAMEQMSNHRSAETHGLMSEIWHKLHGHHLPAVRYFTDISRPKPGGSH